MRWGIINRYCLSRKGLCALITSRVNSAPVLDLPNIPEDIDIIRKAQPDVLLFHGGRRASDLTIVSRLRNLRPKIKVLLTLDERDEETEFQALRAGACGSISRGADVDTLVKAIDVVGRGDIWVSERVLTRLVGKLAEGETPDSTTSNGLTPREWEILDLLASGFRNKAIANRLSVSENTVKTHLNIIYRKLNVDCRLAATLYYFQHAKSGGGSPNESAAPRQSRRGRDHFRSNQKEKAAAA
jgi:DNA-binding NarL/FixJ family response regulator